jgi:phytoene/squalene synthetase
MTNLTADGSDLATILAPMHITVAIGGNAVTVPHRSVVPSAPVVAGDPAPAERAAASVTKEQAENFPVALRVLPRRVRADLRAVYDVVRLIDDTGDEARGDRSALLTALSAELAGLWQGRPAATPELARLAPAVDRLPEEPFQLLIEANLQDQRVTRYADRDELLGY